jgi:polyhydroxyalkanoate synthesis regulator phasin
MLLDEFITATLGLLVFGKEKADEIIDILVEKGEMRRDEARQLVNRLIEKGKGEKERYREQLKTKIIDAMMQEKFAAKEDLQRLEAKLDELAALVREKLQ